LLICSRRLAIPYLCTGSRASVLRMSLEFFERDHSAIRRRLTPPEDQEEEYISPTDCQVEKPTVLVTAVRDLVLALALVFERKLTFPPVEAPSGGDFPAVIATRVSQLSQSNGTSASRCKRRDGRESVPTRQLPLGVRSSAWEAIALAIYPVRRAEFRCLVFRWHGFVASVLSLYGLPFCSGACSGLG